ncbi:Hypothetical predicted protein [Mytilus galloprovincialis]|uniref:Poly [ADP-ribose] polymerase n=1 Tax=Mytilus galloprovincialis TaxID=29158 RepID=A0A8B6EHA6_MYTGA|nr:Hypothetical predicted protein [Mytilus galloprovincialis]
MTTAENSLPWSATFIKGTENFFEFPLNVRLTIFVIPVGFLFIVLGIVSSSWSESDSSRLGLWDHCSTLASYECCDSIINFLGKDTPGWIKTTSAFQIMSMFAAIGCGVAVITTMCVSKYKDNIKINKLVWMSYLITAFLLMISISVYGGTYHKEDWLKDHRLSGSFACATIAFFLYLCGGLAIIIMSFQGENKVEVVYIPKNEEPRPNSSLPSHYLWLAKRPIETPKYWTKFDNSKRIDEWISQNPSSLVHLVPASTRELSAIDKLVQMTWKEDLVGVGRDARGIDPLVYKKLQVIKVERVENAPLFEKYAENRAKLFRKVGRGVPFNKLEQTDNARRGRIITTSEDVLLRDVYPAVNEYYLFHGTPVEIVDAIVTQGLDARLNKRGMFGPAVYAAESSTKSDSYAGLVIPEPFTACYRS